MVEVVSAPVVAWVLRSFALGWPIVSAVVLAVVATAPMRGRHLRGKGGERHPRRHFDATQRQAILRRAAGRCEAAASLFVGRCRARASEVDHIYPWSKGGATVLANGQALCRGHLRSKGEGVPAWWYMPLLQRRRRIHGPMDVTPWPTDLQREFEH